MKIQSHDFLLFIEEILTIYSLNSCVCIKPKSVIEKCIPNLLSHLYFSIFVYISIWKRSQFFWLFYVNIWSKEDDLLNLVIDHNRIHIDVFKSALTVHPTVCFLLLYYSCNCIKLSISYGTNVLWYNHNRQDAHFASCLASDQTVKACCTNIVNTQNAKFAQHHISWDIYFLFVKPILIYWAS